MATSGELETSKTSTGAYYVYLCSGEMQTVTPADSIKLSDDELAILLQGETVARFPRSAIFSCSRTLQSGPVLG